MGKKIMEIVFNLEEGQTNKTVGYCTKIKDSTFIKNLRIKESFNKQDPSLKKEVSEKETSF